MNIKTLAESLPSLKTLANSPEIPAGTSMLIALTLRDVNAIVDAFSTKKNELIDRYVLKDDDGKPKLKLINGVESYDIPDESPFHSEIAAILEEELGERLKVSPIKISKLGNAKVAPVDMLALLWLIVPD